MLLIEELGSLLISVQVILAVHDLVIVRLGLSFLVRGVDVSRLRLASGTRAGSLHGHCRRLLVGVGEGSGEACLAPETFLERLTWESKSTDESLRTRRCCCRKWRAGHGGTRWLFIRTLRRREHTLDDGLGA